MATLTELNKLATDYFKRHRDNGGTSEFDTSINDISQATIKAMKKELGDCWLFKINRYEEDVNKPFLVRYEGQKVYNFEYCAIVPSFNKELEDLLKDYAKDSGFKSGKIMQKLEAIESKIYSLKGLYLTWV